MGYDRGDSFPFDFEQNEFSFGSKSKGKLSPRSYSIHVKGIGSIVSSVCTVIAYLPYLKSYDEH